MYKLQIALIFILVSFIGFSQRGKDGDYTATALNEEVNAYTQLTVYAGISNSTLTVLNNSLTGPAFSGPLEPGDLILIYQVQGISVDVNMYATTWGANWTVQTSYFLNGDVRDFIEYGAVTDYKATGKYEFAEVLSVSGSNTITLTCPLQNSYNVDDNNHSQVIRIPRFENLTVPNNTSITTPKWNGSVGGVVAIEVEKDLSINGTGKISADESGFRGGTPAPNNGYAAPVPGTISNVNDRGYLGSTSSLEGSEKGESIFGGFLDYDNIFSRYCYGAIANGGGGANYHNAGGGGGSNVGVGAYYGYGVVNRGPSNAYDPAWNLESPTMISTPSSGGGRGGYSHAENNRNPLMVGPHNNLWGSDYRRISGGIGGHPLTYDQSRVFMGGGGGAGHQNNSYGGAGGAGGGVVFLNLYGNVVGNGIISANGENGGNAEGTQPGQWSTAKTGDDGAGGAGGGGSIVIRNINPLPTTLNLEAKGGKGGDQNLKYGGLNNSKQADGPGGGGAGGMIAYSIGNPSQDVSGGSSGETNSGYMSDFKVNGATGGASGMSSRPTFAFDVLVENDTICKGQTSTLTATRVGNRTPFPMLTWHTAYIGGIQLGTGNSFTTPALTTTTTYYVGWGCPKTHRVPVTVVISPDILISGVPPTITPETCTGNDGTITGITATGGFGVLTYEWNGNLTPSADLSGATGGTYTLTVKDRIGCSEAAGPFTITTTPGPVIDVSSILIADESCLGTDGSITGITATGIGTLTYEWNGNATPTSDLSGVAAGTYTLTVTDGNGCSENVGPFTINTAVVIAINETALTISDESCLGNNGSITGITASGGTGTLTYAWSSSGGTSLDVTGATNGNYTLTVTDGAGCIATSGPHTINQISAPTVDDVNVLIANASCGANNGSISGITATGTGLNYLWSPSGGTGIDASGLSVGAYTLVITDGTGCAISTGPYTIAAAPSPVLDASGVVLTGETCNGNDGSITGITVAGGSGTLTYDWSGTSTPSADFINVTGGTYTLTVTDGNGCTDVAGPFTIVPSPGPAIDISGILISDESCIGNDGGITGLTVSGGLLPYTYSWNGNTSAGTDLSGMVGGTYTLIVTDDNLCTTSAGPFTINSVSPIVIDESTMTITAESCTGNDGSITGITASGGAGTLNYSWAPSGLTTLDLTGAVNGSYTLTVTDGGSCSATSGPHAINQLSAPTVDATNMVITDASCGLNNGSISGLTVVGTGLTYAWLPSGATALDASSLASGIHSLIVTDGAGCSVTVGPYTVNAAPSPILDASGATISDETCNGNDGGITGITVSGGSGTLLYDWNGTSSVSTDLSAAIGGTYTLTVTDGNGCTDVAGPFTVNTSPSPIIDASGISIADETCIGNDGGISGITATGTALTYLWSPSGITTLDLTGVVNGSYTLTVTDGSGCSTISGPHTVNQIAGPTIDASGILITDVTCGSSNGSISGITATGTSLNYLWSPSGATTLNLTGVTNGSYTLTVTNGIGCSVTSGPHLINQIGAPTIDDANIVILDASCGLNNGSISGLTAAGTGLTYLWSPSGATTLNPGSLSAGAHTLTITDGSGCSITGTPYTVNAAPSPVVDITGVTITDETCDGNDGSITGIAVTGGSTPLTYSWNGNTTSSADFLNAVNGVYTLSVKDSKGCITNAGPFTISSPVIPTVDITTPNQFMNVGQGVNINTVFTPPTATLIWNPIDNLDCTNCPNPFASPNESTMYVVTVVSADGCRSQDSIFIEIEEPCRNVMFPTVFTPNGDGLNDQFCVLGNCLFSMKLQIFNRWGEKVFESTDINDCWDGTFRGEIVNTGVYVYKFSGEKTDGSRIEDSGNVNLIR